MSPSPGQRLSRAVLQVDMVIHRSIMIYDESYCWVTWSGRDWSGPNTPSCSSSRGGNSGLSIPAAIYGYLLFFLRGLLVRSIRELAVHHSESGERGGKQREQLGQFGQFGQLGQLGLH
jgi:hypothetical protein